MHVTLVASEDDACSKYRLLWPEQAVSGTPGLQTAVLSEIPALDYGDERPDVERLQTDVIMLQRPLWRKVVDAIPRLQGLGIAVTVDLDDDFCALHPGHPTQQRLDADTNAGHLMRACAAADLVTVPTQALLDRYAPHGRGELIGNFLPAWALDVADDRDGRTIGWCGVAADHPGDLEATGGAVAAVLRTRSARFRVVGPPEGVAERLALDEPAAGTGMLPIHDYFQALSSIDVGIVPLAPTPFNGAKSPLKGLEWAAAGVPFVASPTREYERLAAQGVGTIASSPDEWAQKLGELIDDEALRLERAHTARRLVRERFLLSDNAWRWPKAWERAHRNRRPQR